MKNRRIMFFLIGIVLIGFGLFGCAANGSEPIISLEQLGEPGKKIGVPGLRDGSFSTPNSFPADRSSVWRLQERLQWTQT